MCIKYKLDGYLSEVWLDWEQKDQFLVSLPLASVAQLTTALVFLVKLTEQRLIGECFPSRKFLLNHD